MYVWTHVCEGRMEVGASQNTALRQSPVQGGLLLMVGLPMCMILKRCQAFRVAPSLLEHSSADDDKLASTGYCWVP